MKRCSAFESPLGMMKICEENDKICEIRFVDERNMIFEDVNGGNSRTPTIEKAARELKEYFYAGRTTFDFSISLCGSDFEKKVWSAALSIPFGRVKTYSDLAEFIGRPLAYRAVANALGKNKLVLVVPCHRVVSKSGIGGFRAGLWRKEWLLKHEGVELSTLMKSTKEENLR
ncbi:methylated-DNA--[protein]-cysteine S-methyltransferase [Mesoaciditoga sp.]